MPANLTVYSVFSDVEYLTKLDYIDAASGCNSDVFIWELDVDLGEAPLDLHCPKWFKMLWIALLDVSRYADEVGGSSCMISGGLWVGGDACPRSPFQHVVCHGPGFFSVIVP
ncbi:hypothetical protein Dimus_002949 [Dionaea muscipula]